MCVCVCVCVCVADLMESTSRQSAGCLRSMRGDSLDTAVCVVVTQEES